MSTQIVQNVLRFTACKNLLEAMLAQRHLFIQSTENVRINILISRSFWHKSIKRFKKLPSKFQRKSNIFDKLQIDVAVLALLLNKFFKLFEKLWNEVIFHDLCTVLNERMNERSMF